MRFGLVAVTSFIVCPHPKNANGFLFGKNFVHDAMLNIGATRISAGYIADRFFKEWRIWVDRRVGRGNQSPPPPPSPPESLE